MRANATFQDFISKHTQLRSLLEYFRQLVPPETALETVANANQLLSPT